VRSRLVVLLGATLLASCTAHVGTFTLVAPEPPDIPRLKQRVRGVDCAALPLVMPAPNLQRAVERAVEQVPWGEMLVDVTVTNDYFVTGVYNRSCYRVEGEVAGEAGGR
jgi:hypothetical protein